MKTARRWYVNPKKIPRGTRASRTRSFGRVTPFRGESSGVIFNAILERAPLSALRLNPDLPPKLEDTINRALEKDRELRFQHASDMRSELLRLKRDTETGRVGIASSGNVQAEKESGSPSAAPQPVSASGSPSSLSSSPSPIAPKTTEAPEVHNQKLWKVVTAATALVVMALIAGGLYYRSHHSKPLTEKDTIVLMGRAPGDRVTQIVAREICLRTNSKASLVGSISSLGSHYVIGLKASNCKVGDVLALEQVEAASKETVLKELDKAAASLRTKLGESLITVQKYDVPLEEATTPSLGALQAYSRGWKPLLEEGGSAPIPMLKRAIELDPNFAMAYLALGGTYLNLSEFGLANEHLRKAFELRERTSENERYLISSVYYQYITGELEKAKQVYEEWGESYPRDFMPPSNLAIVLHVTGQYEKALPKFLEGLRLYPDTGLLYGNLMGAYAVLGRLDERSPRPSCSLTWLGNGPTMLQPLGVCTCDRSNYLALSHRRKARRRWDGSGLQGRGHPP